MRFLSAVVAAAVMAKSMAMDAETKLRMLSKAIPFKGRTLDDGWSITAYDSIQFNACLSLTTQLDDEMQQTLSYSSDLIALWEAGSIVSQKSVVLFSICKTEYCSYEAEDQLYVVDLPTYMQLAGYRPQKTMDYCEACQEAMDWCLYDQYGDDAQAAAEGQDQQADEGDAEGEDGGGRRSRRRLAQKQYVDCDTCSSMGCFQEDQDGQNQNQNQITLEGMVEWVQQNSECQETGVQWNGLDLYSSFMCNDDGTGVELAIFLDDDCQVYNSQASYSDIYQNNGYLQNSHSVVTYPFVYDINCAEDIEWASPEEAANENGEEEQDQNEQPEPNQYCQQLVQDQLTEIGNCYADGNQQNQQDDQANDENQNSYFANQVYDLSQEDSEDPYAICAVVTSLQTEGGGSINAKNKNVYQSGKFYDYSAKKKSSASGANGGKIFGIVLGVLVAIGAAVFAFTYYKKKHDSRKEPLVGGEHLA